MWAPPQPRVLEQLFDALTHGFQSGVGTPGVHVLTQWARSWCSCRSPRRSTSAPASPPLRSNMSTRRPIAVIRSRSSARTASMNSLVGDAHAKGSTGCEDDLALRIVLPIHGDFVPIPVHDSPEPKTWRVPEVPEIHVVPALPGRNRVHWILGCFPLRQRCAVVSGGKRIEGLGRIESPLCRVGPDERLQVCRHRLQYGGKDVKDVLPQPRHVVVDVRTRAVDGGIPEQLVAANLDPVPAFGQPEPMECGLVVAAPCRHVVQRRQLEAERDHQRSLQYGCCACPGLPAVPRRR